MTDHDATATDSRPDSAAATTTATPVVGIGASAGGLEALRTLFAGLKEMHRLSFVVVQHLAPQHRSRLVELIAHETALEVRELRDGDLPLPGTVYVTPPNADVVYRDGALHLRDPAPKIGPKPSADLFLSSLAEGLGEQAVGLILSGTGSDGAHGMRAIKAAGGLTLCQEPDSAKYDGMPRAALQTGAVDIALPPQRLAETLMKLDRREQIKPAQPLEQTTGSGGDAFARILELLADHNGVDLHEYKRSTIRRRIERRMIANEIVHLDAYASYLQHTPAERQLLFGDILISVTAFFRDAEAFAVLRQCIYERVRTKSGGEQFRCWVAGCATGEEAYSIAILVHEAMELANKRLRVQIFATDLDEQGLLTARKACYSKASLTELPEALLERYFERTDDQLQVIPAIRELVVFAKHNLVSDPPFLGMDLITCRNVLIYFTNSLQERVLNTFHYSLDPKGLLFLGRSETANSPPGGFEPLDKHSKLFLRKGNARELPQLRSRQEVRREAALTAQDREDSRGMEVFYALVSAVAPDSVLIDAGRNIRQLLGSAGDYLRLPTGEATMSLPKLLPASLAGELNTLLHRAAKSGRAVRGQRHELELPARGRQRVQMQAVPINLNGEQEYLVGFERFAVDAPPPLPEGSATQDVSSEERAERLEQELRQLREHLQNLVEEHETANEELQALNEELQSTNEELQSSNEELETTNEELQSSNEELTTLNQELNVKSAELQLLNQRLGAIQNAIFYPLLIVDRELRLRNFNPASRYLFRLSETDLASNLKTIPAYVDIGEVTRLLERAFAEELDQSVELQAQQRTFEVRIQLFRDPQQRVAGAVVSFVELSELRRALEDSRLRQQQISAITENTPALITMKDAQAVYTYVNSRFCEVLGRPASAIVGRTDEELFGAEIGNLIRERDFDVLKGRRAIQSEEELELERGTQCWLSSRFPLTDAQNKVYSICTVSLDITERKRHERDLSLFRQVVSAATDGLLIFRDTAGSGDYRALHGSGQLVEGLRLDTGPRTGTPLPTALAALLRACPGLDAAELAAELVAHNSSTRLHCLGDNGHADPWLELRAARLRVSGDGSRYLVVMLNDVSEHAHNERALQEQKEALARFSRLAALGEVAAGISHEIGTPLNAITTKTELLRRMVDQNRIEPKRMHKTTRDIDRMVTNIDQVITGLKSISRMNGGGERERVPVRRLLEDTLRIVGFSSRRSGVPIKLDLGPEPLQIWCNPVQIAQILVNLINNAIDAVAKRDAPWVRIQVAQLAAGVAIDVSDSGDGVPAAIAERIMTPFFTTKGEGKGTGLGLSLSRSIARRHGGELELLCQANPTTFRLLLPMEPTTTTRQETTQDE